MRERDVESRQDPSGKEWNQAEIDLVVSDYFDMRAKYLRGEDFVKARHYERIIIETGRSKGSVESKYMNISATLERLSLPWLKGYVPYRNFQSALLKSVEKYIEREWNSESYPGSDVTGLSEDAPLFLEQPPDLRAPLVSDSAELERIARKYDPALRDARNRKIGTEGERRVFESEVSRLIGEGRSDLAKRVQWVSQELGDGAGYDVLSFTSNGVERFLEVKTTIGHKRTPFYLSRNEHDFACEAADRFRIFRVYDWGREAKAFKIRPPLENSLILEATAYRASFG